MQQGESTYAETALAIHAATRRMNRVLYQGWGYSWYFPWGFLILNYILERCSEKHFAMELRQVYITETETLIERWMSVGGFKK